MKTPIKFYSILILISTIVLSSCVPSKKENVMLDVAKYGTEISQLAEKSLADINTLLANQELTDEYLKIVNDLSPETYTMTYKTNRDEGLQNLCKINAFSSLTSVFANYQLTFESRMSEKNVGLRSKIYAACVVLDSLNINEEAKQSSMALRKNIQNVKYKVAEGVYVLTTIYAKVWHEESLALYKQLSVCKDKSIKGIKKIPVQAFDKEKLKKIVKEPYQNDNILANLYKLQMIKENNEKFAQQEKKLQNITEAFDLLSQIQIELMKRNQKAFKIKEISNKLDVLVNN